MEVRPAIQLQSIIKAMTDVVLPAVDPDNRLAQEQVNLVIRMLGVVSKRLPIQYRYDRTELNRYLALSQQLMKEAAGGKTTISALEALKACASNGSQVFSRALVAPDELESAIFEMRAQMGALLLALDDDGAAASRTAVARLTMTAAKEQLDRERAWLVDMGFESKPSEMPSVESLIEAPSQSPARPSQPVKLDKNIPPTEWIEDLRRHFPVETEIDRVLTRKLMRRAGPGYAPVSLATLYKGVEALFKQQLAESFEIRDPRWLSGGASKVQMAFTLVRGKPGAQRAPELMVLRMEPAESIVETSRLREFQLIKAFECVVPVPPALSVDPEGKFFPYPAMVYGFVPGVPRPTKGAGGISGLGTSFDAVTRPVLGRQFVHHLAAIHAWDWRGADLSGFDVPNAGTQAVEWQLNLWERVWEEDSNEDVPLLRLATSWMRKNMPPVDRLSMLHGDYRTGNFLYTEHDSRITSILDWELGHFGDRHDDLAWAMKPTFGQMAEDGKTLLVGGLLPESEFLEAYQKASGMPVDLKTLKFYSVFNTYKNIVIVLATGFRAARGGKGHQDVLLTYLVGFSYILLEELRLLLRDLL